jgi:tyrosyl-tRNA synthetase
MHLDEKIRVVQSVAAEVLTEEDLRTVFTEKAHPLAYDGFEPSGQIHLAQGILRAIIVNRLASTGIRFVFWIADWFALMNNKMGGDLEKIRTLGEYYVEVWKASGMAVEHVEFVWASERMDNEYWLRTIRIGMANSVERIERCGQIMGRGEKDTLSAAQIFYPVMQCSDVFELDVDIIQLGLDQRKVNVLAREMADKFGWKKPVAIHHAMVSGLQPVDVNLTGADAVIAKKMSKSNPDNAVFMTDDEKEVERKIGKAYCPEGEAQDNPILEYFKTIIFEAHHLKNQEKHPVVIERPEKFGGNVSFSEYSELEEAYTTRGSDGKFLIHPLDLKKACAREINNLLAPVREHFANDAHAKELLAKVKSYNVTR